MKTNVIRRMESKLTELGDAYSAACVFGSTPKLSTLLIDLAQAAGLRVALTAAKIVGVR